jgi:hypothetical protein
MQIEAATSIDHSPSATTPIRCDRYQIDIRLPPGIMTLEPQFASKWMNNGESFMEKLFGVVKFAQTGLVLLPTQAPHPSLPIVAA